jgi:segregation and condensation protein A
VPLEPIRVEASEPAAALAVGAPGLHVQLPVFAGPLQLLLHLIESRQLDVLTVPLGELADGYLQHLATHPVDAANLAEFVAIAAQLILLKSRRLLPGEPMPVAVDDEEAPDEEVLRRRLVEYRSLRDAARRLGERDMAAPLMRREPRESDLPEAPGELVPVAVLVEALARIAAVAEPELPPPELVQREVTIGMQIATLRAALAATGRVVLQAVLATCRNRTEAAVTLLATLELVRRRQIRVDQSEVFGPIVVRALPEPASGGGG